MLDAYNYPRAYYDKGDKRIEFSDVSLESQSVKGKFVIKKNK